MVLASTKLPVRGMQSVHTINSHHHGHDCFISGDTAKLCVASDVPGAFPKRFNPQELPGSAGSTTWPLGATLS